MPSPADPTDDDPLLKFKLSLVTAAFALCTVAIGFDVLSRRHAPPEGAQAVFIEQAAAQPVSGR